MSKKTQETKAITKASATKKSTTKKTTVSKQSTSTTKTTNSNKKPSYSTASLNTKTHFPHVYVPILDKDGNPLTVTNNNAAIRQLLKEHKAYVRYHSPFVVQLTIEVPEFYRRDCVIGIDPGLKHIGVAIMDMKTHQVVYKGIFITNTDQIKDRMAVRKGHRNNRRQYYHKKKRKYAVRQHPETKDKVIKVKHRKNDVKTKTGTVKQYSEHEYKNIKGMESQFNNRKNNAPVTHTHCELSHLNVIHRCSKFYNISTICIENNSFDFQKLADPGIKKKQYQQGILYSYSDVHDYLNKQQNGHCLLCNNFIEHYHHVIPKSEGGSNVVHNMVGLCKLCHQKIHYGDAKTIAQLESKKKGCKAQKISTLNVVMPRIIESLYRDFSDKTIFVQQGYETKKIRESQLLDKEHYNDAIAIILGCLKLTSFKNTEAVGKIIQVRRHNRARTQRLESRKYYEGIYVEVKEKDGSVSIKKVKKPNTKPVSINRHKAIGQTKDSLEEYLSQFSTAKERDYAASQLYVEPGRAIPYDTSVKCKQGCLVHKNGVKHRTYAIIQGASGGGFYLANTDKKKVLYSPDLYEYEQLSGILIVR